MAQLSKPPTSTGANKSDKTEAKPSSDAGASDVPSPMALMWPAYLCAFVDYLGLSISIPILPYFVLELGWDSVGCPEVCPQDATVTDFSLVGRCGEIEGCGTATDVGLSMSMFYLGQMAGNICMSHLSDKVGRKPIIMASLMLSTLGYAWCGLAPNLYHLYFARLFSGLAGGTLPVVQAMVLDTVGDPRERPKYFGLCGATLGVAFVVGPGLGAAVGAALGKRAALLSPVFVALVCCIHGMYRIKETRKGGGFCGALDPSVTACYAAGHRQFLADIAAKKRAAKGGGKEGGAKPPSTTPAPAVSAAGAADKDQVKVAIEGSAADDAAGDAAGDAGGNGTDDAATATPKAQPAAALENGTPAAAPVGAGAGGEKKGPPAKLPAIALVCAFSMLLAAFSFTAMTSMTALAWVPLFNFGPTELGIFLTVAGAIGIINNACLVKMTIKKYTARNTLLAACICQAIGIGGYTFVTPFYLHAPFFLMFISFSYAYQMPCLLTLCSEQVPPQMRGKATGLIAAGMSLGFGLMPFVSGPLFESSVFRLTHEYGSFSHAGWMLGAFVSLCEFALLYCNTRGQGAVVRAHDSPKEGGEGK